MVLERSTDVDFSSLLPNHIENTVQTWLDDDMPSFDVGGLVVGTSVKTAKLYMKSPGIFAGKPFVDLIFTKLLKDCSIEWEDFAIEGSFLPAKSDTDDDDNGKKLKNTKIVLATITGPANNLLRGERTALNTLSRCSGVATSSYEAVLKARSENWKGMVAGTRKTTPGFRIVEKYGLLVGGAATHRLDLSQMVMLKDNHIWSAGSITKAVKLAKKAAGFSQKIEVECLDLSQAEEAAEAGADITMLDNFTPEQLKKDAAILKQKYPHLIIEASGGITSDTIAQYFSPHVDVISQGKLTQGYPSIDYSLKIIP